MTVEEFIAQTQEVIAQEGFDSYLPTLIIETRGALHIAVLEDPPSDVDVESFVKDWASQAAGHKQNYLLAFKLDDQHFKVMSRRSGITAERVVAVEPA